MVKNVMVCWGKKPFFRFTCLSKIRVGVLWTVLLGFGFCLVPAAAAAGTLDGPLNAAGREGRVRANQAATAEAPSRAVSAGSGWRLAFAPAGRFYPVYPADPLAPTVALNAVRYRDSEIPDAGDRRYMFRIGGRLGLLRLFPQGRPEEGMQLNLHGTFLGVFDRENSLDNIGWDGLYGIDLTWRGAWGPAFKLGINHDSAHVGDEYTERTGRERMDYTRQEYVLGASLPVKERFRVYGEGGYAFDLRNEDVQDHWRLQAGLEVKDEDALWGGRLGCYAAADVTAYQESDWDPDVTVQAGLIVPVRETLRDFRFGVEYRDGRSVLGEFSMREETYWTWGIWIDL